MSDQDEQGGSSHPTTGTYLTIALILTVLTLVEVGVFYIPAFAAVLAPLLLILSACKFLLVVMFYMHLKGDNRLFTIVFSGPLVLAAFVMIALMFLFGSWFL